MKWKDARTGVVESESESEREREKEKLALMSQTCAEQQTVYYENRKNIQHTVRTLPPARYTPPLLVSICRRVTIPLRWRSGGRNNVLSSPFSHSLPWRHRKPYIAETGEVRLQDDVSGPLRPNIYLNSVLGYRCISP
jgi:hypothetical protein